MSEGMQQVCGNCSNWERDPVGSERKICAMTGRDRSAETPCDVVKSFTEIVHGVITQNK